MIDSTRWRQAQRLELDFWKRWKSLPPYRGLDIPAYWRSELEQFEFSLSDFAGKRVLDIGCGPEGLIHYADAAAERIRLDPLLPQYADRQMLRGTRMSLCAMGEALPLASHSVDVAICFNALDHMLDPERALAETARVLKPGGCVLLMIHTFPWWTRPAHFIDRMHPHHFTDSEFATLVKRHFRIHRQTSIVRQFSHLGKAWSSPQAWKYLLAGLIVSGTYIRGSTISS